MHTPDENPVLSSPELNLFFDLDQAIFFKQNNENIIYECTQKQLPAMNNVSMLNIKLSKGHIVEPHWHPNTTELVFVTCGSVSVSVFNPITRKVLSYTVRPNQVVYLPMGWWHWIIACEDHTSFIAQFDNAKPQIVLASDVLKKTPAEVFQLAYGIDGVQLAKVLQPIQEPVVIGPPLAASKCEQKQELHVTWSDGIRWRIGENQSAG